MYIDRKMQSCFNRMEFVKKFAMSKLVINQFNYTDSYLLVIKLVTMPKIYIMKLIYSLQCIIILVH